MLAIPPNAPRELLAELLPALEELHVREARHHLVPYTEVTFPDYRAEWYHREVAAALEAVYRGDLLRLMVWMPPRHGKTFLISERFPAWCLGQDPTLNIIANAYGGTLTDTIGRKLRNLMGGVEHLRVFPGAGLSPDSKARDRWNTKAGGGYLSAGLNGGITGFGFQVGIIDDPVKGHEAADSPHQREMAWSWYQSDFYSRRMPRFMKVAGKRSRIPAAIVVVQTRWHDDDLSGRLLNTERADSENKWHVINYPMLVDEGKPTQRALWEDQFPLKEVLETKAETTPRVWRSLYQQDPTPDEGTYFMREWLQYRAPPPREHMNVYGASDYATKYGAGDWTVHAICGVTPQDDIHILDLWRGQTETDVWIEAAIDLMVKWDPNMWAEEDGQILKSIGPFLRKRMLERKVYCRRESFPSAADKPTRARSIQGRWAMRKVYLPADRPVWLPDLETELLKFPLGAHDDIVDTLSLIGRLLATMHTGQVPTKDTTEPPDKANIHAMSLDQLWEAQRMDGRLGGRERWNR